MSAGDPNDHGSIDERGLIPGPRRRTARWTAALLAVATLVGTAACAGPPSKGDIHGVTLNQSHNNVFILAREPSAAMGQGQLVTNFLQALTGDQKDPTFSAGQEYLTPYARSHWNPGSSPTDIVQYTPQAIVTPQEGLDANGHPAAASPGAQAASPPPAVGTTSTVTVTGTEIAQLDPFGFFSYLPQPQSVTQTLVLKFLGAGIGWRIDTPPKVRMVSAESFKRVYQAYQSPLPVYLPSRGAIPQMDQVYLTQDSGKADYTYDALARAVLHGRYPGQDTGLTLQAAVTVDQNGLATVPLKAPPAGMTDLTGVEQAILQTFRDASQQLLSPTPVTRVDLTSPGCGSVCHRPAFLPDTLPQPTVYWVCPAQNGTDAAIVFKQLPGASTVCPQNGGKAQSVVGMAGVQLARNTPIAVKQSPDSTNVKTPAGTIAVAAVERDGSVVVLNDKNADQRVWYRASAAGKNLTDLEWDPVDGSLWVVDDGNLYRVRDPGEKGPSPQAQDLVAVPGGTVSRFKLSPDGQRAVVVNGPPPSSSGTTAAQPGAPQIAWMVTVDRTGDAPTLPTDTPFRLLSGPAQESQVTPLQTVADAAWADGRTVVLLGTQIGSTTPKLFKVYSDGSQDATIIDPDDAEPGALHIAAAMGGNIGHPALWTFSDAPSLNDSTVMDSYFKRSGSSDSSQEVGYSPVVATVTSG
jgi:hypothetical protein